MLYRPQTLPIWLIFFCTALDVGAMDAPRPNILLILADDVGREVLECYGGTSFRTPRLNALASEGTRFAHAYVMPSCHPTRVTLLSAQYPFRFGRLGWGVYPEHANERTVAQHLRAAGYATAIAGKWQLSLLKENVNRPHEMGFDQYCLFGWHEGPRYYQPLIWQNGRRREDVSDRYGPDVYVEFLTEFMRSNRERPFFAFYSMALCHDVTDDLEEPVPFGPRGRYDSYPEMVAAMDERVGEIVDAVDELGLRDRTLIIYIADNGTPAESILTARNGEFVRLPNVSNFGELKVPGGKTQLTDWGTRVPMIARWPGRVRQNAVSDALLDASDFLPSLVELTGARPPADIRLDGQSFVDPLLGRGPGPRQWVFAEQKGIAYLRNRRWKLYNDGRFFDLSESSDESRPLDAGNLSGEAAAALQSLTAEMARLAPSGSPD
jgi:arylsulfatase A